MGGVGLAFNGLHNNYVGENNIFLVTSKLQYQLTSTLLEEQWFPFQKKNTRSVQVEQEMHFATSVTVMNELKTWSKETV